MQKIIDIYMLFLSFVTKNIPVKDLKFKIATGSVVHNYMHPSSCLDNT